MSERPRDHLGRPTTGAGVDPVPPRSAITAQLAWDEAMHYLDSGLPFHAHEVFEQRWRCAPEPERRLWQLLARWCAALTHAARGNMVGAHSLGMSSLADLADVTPVPPVDLALVRESLERL